VTNETPVGCVIVHEGEVIARGMNATNVTRNGTRHAEFMAIASLFSVAPKSGPRTTCLKPKVPPKVPEGKEDDSTYSQEWRSPDEGNEDGSKGHLYPYGQKTTSLEHVPTDILQKSILYVTVEPCVMCASLLRQFRIKKVYFGAVNDKFGGCGGVFNIHANGLPPGSTDRVQPEPKRYLFPDGGGSLGVSYPRGGGHGSNVEPGFEIEGGWSRDEAVGLLRRFYVQENGRGMFFLYSSLLFYPYSLALDKLFIIWTTFTDMYIFQLLSRARKKAELHAWLP
jgi:tRNA-specific adenosine deaminase 2